jgi:hypothetical protein
LNRASAANAATTIATTVAKMANVRQLVPRGVVDGGDPIAEPIYVPITDCTPWKSIGFTPSKEAA